jgi:hypothetical protein
MDLFNCRFIQPQPTGQRIHVPAFFICVHLDGHPGHGVNLPGQFRAVNPADN